MTREDGQVLVAAVQAAAGDGRIACAAAEEVASRHEAPLPLVGEAIEASGLRIAKCQLGLFGFGTGRPHGGVVMPTEQVAPALEDAIAGALVGGRLPCAAAWGVADRLGLGRIEVAEACEALGVKVKPCQLGAF